MARALPDSGVFGESEVMERLLYDVLDSCVLSSFRVIG